MVDGRRATRAAVKAGANTLVSKDDADKAVSPPRTKKGVQTGRVTKKSGGSAPRKNAATPSKKKIKAKAKSSGKKGKAQTARVKAGRDEPPPGPQAEHDEMEEDAPVAPKPDSVAPAFKGNMAPPPPPGPPPIITTTKQRSAFPTAKQPSPQKPAGTSSYRKPTSESPDTPEYLSFEDRERARAQAKEQLAKASQEGHSPVKAPSAPSGTSSTQFYYTARGSPTKSSAAPTGSPQDAPTESVGKSAYDTPTSPIPGPASYTKELSRSPQEAKLSPVRYDPWKQPTQTASAPNTATFPPAMPKRADTLPTAPRPGTPLSSVKSSSPATSAQRTLPDGKSIFTVGSGQNPFRAPSPPQGPALSGVSGAVRQLSANGSTPAPFVPTDPVYAQNGDGGSEAYTPRAPAAGISALNGDGAGKTNSPTAVAPASSPFAFGTSLPGFAVGSGRPSFATNSSRAASAASSPRVPGPSVPSRPTSSAGVRNPLSSPSLVVAETVDDYFIKPASSLGTSTGPLAPAQSAKLDVPKADEVTAPADRPTTPPAKPSTPQLPQYTVSGYVINATSPGMYFKRAPPRNAVERAGFDERVAVMNEMRSQPAEVMDNGVGTGKWEGNPGTYDGSDPLAGTDTESDAHQTESDADEHRSLWEGEV